MLGIDPGTTGMGFALLALDADPPRLVTCGIVETPRGGTNPERLLAIATALDALIAEHQPRALAATGGALDRPVDVRVRHVHGAGPIDREAEPEITLGVRSTFARREHDLARHLGENDSPFDVRRALLALDLTPL